MENKNIGHRIIKDINRVSAELLTEIATFSTTELCDGATVFNAMDYEIKPRTSNKKIVGPAITVKVPIGASVAAMKAIEIAQAGDIIVIDGHGCCNNALWGDMRSYMASLKNINGVVIDGAFRDIDENEDLDFPVFAKGLCCGAASKNESGEINVPISCGGVIVNPGDIIVGDRNGVVVVRPDEAKEIMKNALDKRSSEEEKIKSFTNEILKNK
ncbi:MAG: RraA family protein [Lachnospiraceae bacterium]|nr:RraA family protein [Lachnospiraceae bacterium]